MIVIAIIGAMLCALLCGCGGKDTETGAPAVVTPRVLSDKGSESGTTAPPSVPAPETPSEPEPSPVQEPTTEPSTATPWFETSGLRFSRQGELTVHTNLSSQFDDADNVPLDCSLTVSKEDIPGEGKKTITAEIKILPHLETYEDGTYTWAWVAMYGFLDQYTGSMIVCEIEDGDVVGSTIEYGGKSYNVSLKFNILTSGSYYDLGYSSKLFPALLHIHLTCPEDYDGAAFFICGCSREDFEVYTADPIGHYDSFDNSGYDFYVVDGR